MLAISGRSQLQNMSSNPNYDIFKNFVAGGVGGTCCVATGHPFDTVKVRLQTMPKALPGETPAFTGAFDCLRQTVVKEGFFALYKVRSLTSESLFLVVD